MSKVSKTPNSRLFIGGLPYRFTEGELLALFAPFGRVISLKIMHTPWGKSRGIGFIEFDNLNSATDAKVALHNHKVAEDRTIIVDYADPDPMTTPEGQQRHLTAVTNNPKKFKNFADAPRPRNQNRPQTPSRPNSRKPSRPVDSRQSVYDQRTHHSHVGSKFARRNKRK